MLVYVQVRKDEIWLKFCQDFHDKYCDRLYNVQFTFSRSVIIIIIIIIIIIFKPTSTKPLIIIIINVDV